jgi:hypothetical protein
MTKGLFWCDPNETITILDKTKDAANEYGHRFGADVIVLRQEHIKALQDGRMLAWHDSEYSTFVVLDEDD